MPATIRDKGYLWDMLNAALAVAEFVEGKEYQDYLNNKMLRAAVERDIGIIGEAARRLSNEFRNENPEIPWRSIIGQRNAIIHEYGDIDDARMWKVAKENLPPLITALRKLLPDEPDL